MAVGRYTSAHICICIAGVIACYIPLYIGLDATTDLGPLRHIHESDAFKDPTKMAVAITFPMLVDIFLELSDSKRPPLDHYYFIEWVYILALLLPNGLLLLPHAPTTLMYVCSIRARDGLFYGTLNCLLSTQGDTLNWERFVLLINVLTQIVNFIFVWYNFVEHRITLKLVSNCIAVAVVACIVGACIRYFVIHNRTRKRKDTYENMVMQSIVIILLNCVVKWVLYFTLGGSFMTETTDKKVLVGFIWTEIATYTITFALYSRVRRDESAVLRDRLKSNKTFVAHISHEIRTPLNSISLGMQMLFKKINSDARCAGRPPLLLRDAINDLGCIDVAANVALQTVNELLTFDKLESNSLCIERQCIRVIDLIKLAAVSFKLQV
jgi:signal transduction histidine kinase